MGQKEELGLGQEDEQGLEERADQEVNGVLSPSERRARTRSVDAEQVVSEKQMLKAVVGKVLKLWPFSPLLEIEGNMFEIEDNMVQLPGMEIPVNELLQACVCHWQRFPEEAGLDDEVLEEKLKDDIKRFPTAVLMVRPKNSRCGLSLGGAFPEQRFPCASRSLSGGFP